MAPRHLKGKSSTGPPTGRRPSARGDGWRYPIPRASARAWQALKSQPDAQLNPGLIFDRFAPDWTDQATLKKDGLEEVRKAAERVDKQLLDKWNARWEAMARAVYAEPFLMKTDWRFIAGLGRKGSLEVGFTFHRYGFPILPGSSVKGVARAWALLRIVEDGIGKTSSLRELDDLVSADGEPDSEERKKYETWRESAPEASRNLAEDFRTIFGTRVAAGRAIFLDAIPVRTPRLELDVMNPHYPDYYQDPTDKIAPTSWQDPRPVYFLTVAPGTEFRFAVGWRGPMDLEGHRLRRLAEEWLRAGLQNLGAGAKTSTGYGYFIEASTDRPIGYTTPATTAEPASQQPSLEPLTWRTGTVREYRPDRGIGRLIDDETGEERSFRRDAIAEKGWSPGKGHKVQYAFVEHKGQRKIVKVRRR